VWRLRRPPGIHEARLAPDLSAAGGEISGPSGRTGFGYQLNCPLNAAKVLYLIDFTDNAATLNWVTPGAGSGCEVRGTALVAGTR
jgi:hypothetical protein